MGDKKPREQREMPTKAIIYGHGEPPTTPPRPTPPIAKQPRRRTPAKKAS